MPLMRLSHLYLPRHTKVRCLARCLALLFFLWRLDCLRLLLQAIAPDPPFRDFTFSHGEGRHVPEDAFFVFPPTTPCLWQGVRQGINQTGHETITTKY